MSTDEVPLGDVQKPSISILVLGGESPVEALSSLLVLEKLMDNIAVHGGTRVTPCHLFDIIVGAGAGGLAALLLGRMHLSADQAIEEYMRLGADMAFKPSNAISQILNPQKSLIDGIVLQEKVGDILERIYGDRDAPFSHFPPRPTDCRTAVLAATGPDTEAPICIFRSYTVGDRPRSLLAVREVAHATASVADWFTFMPVELLGGEVAGYKHPAEFGISEAEQLWPGQDIGCLVSIGTSTLPQGTVPLEDTSAPGSSGVKPQRRFQKNRLPYLRPSVGPDLMAKLDLKRDIHVLVTSAPSHVRRVELSLRSASMLKNPDALRLLSILAILPSGICRDDFPRVFSHIPNVNKTFITLRDVALAYEDSAHTRHVPSTVSSYIIKHHPPPAVLFEDVKYFYFKMARQWKRNLSGAYSMLTRNRHNIEAIVTRALNHTLKTGRDEGGHVAEVALDWARFLSIIHLPTGTVELILRVIRIEPGHRLLASCLYLLGKLQYTASNYDAAREALAEALEIFTEGRRPVAALVDYLEGILRNILYEDTGYTGDLALACLLGITGALEPWYRKTALVGCWSQHRAFLNTAIDQMKMHGMTAAQVSPTFSCLRSALHIVLDSPVHRRAVLALKNEDAISFLDLLQTAIHEVNDLQSKKKYIRCLRRLSCKSGQLPASLSITHGLRTNDKNALAGGGFADVWKGELDGYGQVAIKALRIFSRDPDGLEKARKIFLKEAVIWGQLKCANVLALLGVSMTLFPLCLVSPWMKNGDIMTFLGSNLRANRIKLIEEVAHGLSYLHVHGIVHGDLKGGNVLVDNKGHACICDFGLAVIAQNTDSMGHMSMSTSHMSTSSSMRGTVRWMAPELIFPILYDFKSSVPTSISDVYAFACLTLEILTGQPPFRHHKLDASVVFELREGGRPERPKSTDIAARGLSDALWKLIEACWSNIPADRPSMSTVVRWLGPISEDFILSTAADPSVDSQDQLGSSVLRPSQSEDSEDSYSESGI